MDTNLQWPKEMEHKLEHNETYNQRPILEERSVSRGVKQEQKGGEIALNCPRCNSINTKFCYYNNYSLTQPRYYCKTCKRYWTQGGTLRNVPVGGGTRKNKRPSSSSSSSSSSKKQVDRSSIPQSSSLHQNSIILDQAHDPNSLSFSRGLASFMSMPLHDASTTYNPSAFRLDGLQAFQGVQGSGTATNTTSRLLFPFEDLRSSQASNTTNHQFGENQVQQQGDSTNGYWNGMLGGGSWPHS